jgi:hypothetical protein
LSWNANSEPDLAGYVVSRAVNSEGPYDRLTGSLVSGTAYTDTAVNNGTTYYYSVSAEDTTGNISAASAPVSAKPEGNPATSQLLINAISLQASGNKSLRITANVTVVDETGAAVSGALVSGTFSGDLSGTQQTNTDTEGLARFQGNSRLRKPASVTFCVDDASKTGLTLEPASLGCTTANF